MPNQCSTEPFVDPLAGPMWNGWGIDASNGRVFVGSDIGYVYSLDAETGCVHWSFQAQAGVRTAISIGAVTGAGSASHAAYFGDVAANVYGSSRKRWRSGSASFRG